MWQAQSAAKGRLLRQRLLQRVDRTFGIAEDALHVSRQHERVRAKAAVLVPHAISTSDVTLDLRGTSFGLGGALDRKIGSRVWIATELGLTLDVVRYRASAFVDPSYRAEAGGSDVRPVAYTRCGVRVDLGAVSFGVAAAFAVDLVRAHYDVVDNGRRSAVVTPWLVRPGLALAASW
jgi:hypothetical protein